MKKEFISVSLLFKSVIQDGSMITTKELENIVGTSIYEIRLAFELGRAFISQTGSINLHSLSDALLGINLKNHFKDQVGNYESLTKTDEIFSSKLRQQFSIKILIQSIYDYIQKQEISKEHEERLLGCLDDDFTSIDRFTKWLEIKDLNSFLSDCTQSKIWRSQEGNYDFTLLSDSFPLTVSYCKLEGDYQTFADRYLIKNCRLCNDIPSHGDTVLCLTCGEVICRSSCVFRTGLSNSKGNLSAHSELHNGQAVFLEIQALGLIYIHTSKAIVQRKRAIFVNKTGLNIMGILSNPYDKRIDRIDFRDFKLNPETSQHISKIYEGNLIASEFFNCYRNGGRVFLKSTL
jgi:hypothetical protein